MLILWKGCPGTRNVGCCGSGKTVMNFLLGLHDLKPLPADRCLVFFPHSLKHQCIEISVERGLMVGESHAEVSSLSLKFYSIMMLSLPVSVLQSIQIFHDTKSISNTDGKLNSFGT